MILKAIILGIIEGLTEFLPISSTGHLILANEYLTFTGDFANLFSVVIQSGAILAVVVFFRDIIFPKDFSKKELTSFAMLWSKVVVGIIPIGVMGILFEDKIKEYLFKPVPVAITLIVGAIALIIIENTVKKDKITEEEDLTFTRAFLIGLFQVLAIIPGMSRSASTIMGGRLLGFSRKIAAEFSFFLAIPVLVGASILELVSVGFNFTGEQWAALATGIFVSFVVAYAVIAFFMNYIKKHDFKLFAYYRIVLGIIVLIILL